MAASFLEELWNGVFTPGASPTLLLATNASFAALQLLLFVLLLSTYSIHFLILSFLCGALWYSINWFVVEVNRFPATQAEKGEGDGDAHQKGTAACIPDAVDTEREVKREGVFTSGSKKLLFSTAVPSSSSSSYSASMGPFAADTMCPCPPSVPVKASTATSAQGVEVRQHNNPMDSLGYISTDSEWEKVDETER